MPKKYIPKKVKEVSVIIPKIQNDKTIVQSPLEKIRKPEKKPEVDKFFV